MLVIPWVRQHGVVLNQQGAIVKKAKHTGPEVDPCAFTTIVGGAVNKLIEEVTVD